MSVFTPEQEARVREIVAEMVGQAFRGMSDRVAEAIVSSVVQLPIHQLSDIAVMDKSSLGNAERISGLDLASRDDLSDKRWLYWNGQSWGQVA